jgi:hypothetical protein
MRINRVTIAMTVATILCFVHCGTAVQSTGGVVSGISIEPQAKVLIVPFGDAVDKGGSTVGGSGGAMTAAVRDALVTHGFSPVVGDSKTLADSFVEADKLQMTYVLKGTLINWEDNATEWSGRPDTAGVSIELYRVSAKSLAGSTTENVRASALSFTPGTPDRFVPELVEKSLSRIFGWRAKLTT